MNRKHGIIRFIATVAMFFPALAFAHSENDGTGFVSGFLHPISGMDHLLAMLSVGIVSAQLGGRNIWTIPTMFVSFMIVGGIIGFEQIPLPHDEVGIALSVVMLGLAIMAVQNHFHGKFGSHIIMLFVAFFGTLHGHAHGMEMPHSASPAFYSFGFVVCTATIHLVGVFIGYVLTENEKFQRALSYLGTSVAGAGVYILYSL